MAGPLTVAIATIKEAAEKAALAVKESLKLTEVSELARQGFEQLRIKELNNVKEMLRNPPDDVKAGYKHLFNEIAKVKEAPELRGPLMNRLRTEPNLMGQIGEFHAEAGLRQYGNFESQNIIETANGTFRADFKGELFKDMPVETLKIANGTLFNISEVIPKGEKFGIEIKNGLYELRNNIEHVKNQALAAKELTGKGFIGISKSMAETIGKNPELYSDFFNTVAENDIKVIITQPTMTQQIANISNMF